MPSIFGGSVGSDAVEDVPVAAPVAVPEDGGGAAAGRGAGAAGAGPDSAGIFSQAPSATTAKTIFTSCKRDIAPTLAKESRHGKATHS